MSGYGTLLARRSLRFHLPRRRSFAQVSCPYTAESGRSRKITNFDERSREVRFAKVPRARYANRGLSER
jgi:hypothetical protein